MEGGCEQFLRFSTAEIRSPRRYDTGQDPVVIGIVCAVMGKCGALFYDKLWDLIMKH